MRSWMPMISGRERTTDRMRSTNSGEGGWPRRGSMVSLAAQMPDQRMKRATRVPHQPSICQWRKCPAR